MTDDDKKEERRAKKAKRELGLMRLNDPFYLGLAAAKLGGDNIASYGNLLKESYKEVLKNNAPGQAAYQELFQERLLNGEAITDQSLQSDSLTLIGASLRNVYVSDLMFLIGSEKKSVKGAYEQMLVSDLNPEEGNELMGSYMKLITDSQAANVLGLRQEQTKKGLEDKFCKPAEK